MRSLFFFMFSVLPFLVHQSKAESSTVVETAYENLTLPFHFHIVDTKGTEKEQVLGGFWSTGFYILRDSASTTTSIISSSIAAIPTASSTIIFPITSVPQSEASTASTTLTPTSTPIIPKGTGMSLSTKIGLGVGIGIGVPILISLAALAFFCGRRIHRNTTTTDTPLIFQNQAPLSYPDQTQLSRFPFSRPPIARVVQDCPFGLADRNSVSGHELDSKEQKYYSGSVRPK
ncbi:MAG: hypothetical protein M1834_003223 [Cirrosporium novae-zelandiae]|nr:MAG: hypothetical protein M1834_003223 [Cirrosporium novae-zelandiae]